MKANLKDIVIDRITKLRNMPAQPPIQDGDEPDQTADLIQYELEQMEQVLAYLEGKIPTSVYKLVEVDTLLQSIIRDYLHNIEQELRAHSFSQYLDVTKKMENPDDTDK